jgi:cytochrome c biogenesis protein CcmG/thiol:disulfide interchange protein DsbE
MQKIFLILSLSLIISLVFAIGEKKDKAPELKKIPYSEIKTLAEEEFHTTDFSNDGKPFIINFWATWCAPCKKELDNISKKYDSWQSETGVKIITISIDDAKSLPKVKSAIESKGWKFEAYLDDNKVFSKAMGVGNPPYTFLVDGNGNIVYEHVGYKEGDEDSLYSKVKMLIKK